MAPRDWIDLSQDRETGIETLRAHFEGHAIVARSRLAELAGLEDIHQSATGARGGCP
ncbi:MAG: hypothetical protein P8Y78_07370 [Acidihalobacter sp.]